MKKALLAAAMAFTCIYAANAETLKFGTEATFAPFEFTNEKAEVIGFDVDIIKAIGEAEGFDVNFSNMPFDSLVPSVLTSQLDGAIAGITITEDRAKSVAFSDPYYDSRISAVIRKDDEKTFAKLNDLSKSRLCAQIGTTGADTAKDISGNVGAFNTVPEAFMELKTKGCDAVVNDRPVNLYYLTTTNDKTVVEVQDYLDNGESYGIIVNKKNTELLERINSGLKKIKEDGTYSKIHEKWFGVAK